MNIDVSTIVVIAAVNRGYIPMAMNWYRSICGTGLGDHVAFLALDDVAREHCARAGLCHYYVRVDDSPPSRGGRGDVAEFRSKRWNDIMFARHAFVLDFLRQGYIVLFSDCDIVFRADPLQDLAARFEHDGVEILFQSDWGGDYITHSRLCPGFYCALPTQSVIEALERVIASTGQPDQQVFNEMASRGCFGDARLGVLPLELYPNGRYWYRIGREGSCNPYLVHYNWLKGNDAKVLEMVKDGWWTGLPQPQIDSRRRQGWRLHASSLLRRLAAIIDAGG